MTWQDDPYEWIDPEKGRQGGVLRPAPKSYPLPNAFKVTRKAASDLRERVVRRVLYYAGRTSVAEARELLIRAAGARRVSDVPDDKLPAVLKAFES